MSRIKGRYKPGGYTTLSDPRWLDTATGHLWNKERDGQRCHSGFTPDRDGTWYRGLFVWVPDVACTPSADWYVLADRGTKNTTNQFHVKGPYTEQGARSDATDRAARYPDIKYSVFQVLVGNSVQVVPPTPPKPEVIWS